MRVFSTSYGGSHVKTIEPILNELSTRGHECIYMPQTVACLSLEAKIKIIKFIDFVDKNDERVLYYGEELAKKHHNPGAMSYYNSVMYLGTLFKELVDEVGDEVAWEKYNKHGLRACNPIRYMINVLDQVKPDFVISTNAPRMERALLNAAVIKNIKNISVVDFQGLRSFDWLASRDSCGAIAVNAQITIEKLVEKGRKPEDIYLTGSPLFENVNNINFIESSKEWRSEAKLNEKKIVFFAAQPDYTYVDLPLKIRLKLYEICQKHNYQLVTRFHPSLKKNEVEFINEIISKNSQNVEEIVHACDVCITMTSTVCWMAILANKPTIILNMSSTSSYLSISDNEGALIVDSIDNIESAIVSLLSENSLSRKLREKRLKIKKFSNSTKQIVNLIEELK